VEQRRRVMGKGERERRSGKGREKEKKEKEEGEGVERKKEGERNKIQKREIRIYRSISNVCLHLKVRGGDGKLYLY